MVGTNRRPDILVANGRSCIIIETEWIPARTLVNDVEEKMTCDVTDYGTPSAVIGIRIPAKFRKPEKLSWLESTDELEYFLLKDGDEALFPTDGYLKGSLTDIMTAIRLSMTPKRKIDECVDAMIVSIGTISRVISELDERIREDITRIVGRDVNGEEQTWKMASLILLNASIFQEELAEHVTEIPSMDNTGTIGVITKQNLTEAWETILRINYHPIFNTAIRILDVIPMASANAMIENIHEAVSTIIGLRVQKSGDVYGLLYQRMLHDRTNAAAYYTVPEAATLLAALVMPQSGNSLYEQRDEVTSLKIADFACGTGMLLTAAYNQIINNAIDINVADLHENIMAEVLRGYDIMPTAAHITASNLSGLFPGTRFTESRIYTMHIGPVGGGGYNIGSLDLLREDQRLIEVGERHHGRYTERTKDVAILNKTLDYILMNPPYVRATNHGGGRTDPIPPFAVFGISPDDQIRMGDILATLYADTCAHGHAGLSSYFTAIADRKLKAGGMLGLILPATVPSGSSWRKVRRMFVKKYHNITIIMTTKRKHGNTFSSDTGMNEIMLVARKNDESPKSNNNIKMVLLDRVPMTRLEAIETAKTIRNTALNQTESEMGGSLLSLGDMSIGAAINTPTDNGVWNVGRVSNIRLWQYAFSIINGSDRIQMVKLNKIADLGKHTLDIIGTKHDGAPQGPFNKIPLTVGFYPCLWSNNSKTQKTIIVKPDCSLEKKHDATEKHVEKVLKTVSKTHVNLQIRYTSQRLIVAYTKKPVIGGRSWPNVMLHNKAYEKALSVWMNSIFGILSYWFKAGFQQMGRGQMSREAFRIFPVLDFRGLNKSQLVKIDKIFDDLCEKEMLPVNRLNQDPVRKELDKRLCDVLDINTSELKWVYKAIVREPQLGRTDIDDVQSDEEE